MTLHFPLLIPPREIDQSLDELLDWPFTASRLTDGRTALRHPAVDVRDEDKELVLTAALPGVKPEDVEICIDGQTLTIHAESKAEEKVEQADYVLQERRYGAFRRVISLPVRVDAEGTTARIQDGVLTLRMPKAAEATAKRIEVVAAGT
jgi:HSP20 family protein